MLMDGLPGVIVSDDDFGVNAAGMMVTETTITQFEGWDPAGKPEFVRARKALQYSRSIDDFVRIMLDGNNGGYANDWLIGDNKTGEIALFELGLKNHSVQRTKDGCFFGANFPDTDKLTREETKFDASKKDSSPNARKVRWEQLIGRAQGQDRPRAGQGVRDRRFRRIRPQARTQRADALRPGRDLAARRARVGLGAVLSRRNDPVQGHRRRLADQLAFWGQVGHHGSDFLAEDVPEGTQGIRMDARAAQGHEVPAVVPVRGGDEDRQ